ncbi:MAG: matrixin family metalloprotease [Bradyrhizobiaceae bacterium]|nr:matrixin family metalloprotease [Bradyrhizobiaceae bacterium]
MALAALVLGAPECARAEQEYLLLRLDGSYVKWGGPKLGTGAKASYAFVQDEMKFAGARNCGAMVALAPSLQRLGIASAQLRGETSAAFAMWEQAANISFEEIGDPVRADILIGAQAEPRGRAFANVEYDHAGNGPTRQIEQSLICLSPEQPWKIGFGGDPTAYDLRYTIAHEIGHAIGLNHPGPHGQLMGFQYRETSRSLQAGDIEGAVALYGSREKVKRAVVPTSPKAKPAEMGLR